MRQVPERPGTEPHGERAERRGDGTERHEEGAELREGAERRGDGVEPHGYRTGLRAAAFGPPVETGLGRAAQLSVQLLLVTAAIAVIGFVIVQLRLVVLPVLAALFLATILMPGADLLRRAGFPSALAALSVMVVALSLLAGLTTALAPPVADELGQLGERVREGFGEVGSTLESVGVTEEEIDRTIDDAADTLHENSGVIGRGVVTGALFVVELIIGLLLALVLLFFFLKDGERIWGWVMGLLPARHRDDVHEVGRRAWYTLGHYLRGVAFVATFDAVAIGIGLAILGVPLVLPLAVLTFFSAFFPLVGAFTAGLVAALVALVAEGVVTALIVVAIIIAVQQIEGDVIYPVVVGRVIRLHPVAILLAVTAGAVVAGVVGALLAAPTAAIVWTAVKYFRDERAEPGSREVAPASAEG